MPLLGPRSPSNIAGFIAASVIDPVKRMMLGRSRTYVGDEVLIAIKPCLTHGDATLEVVLAFRMIRPTPIDHLSPSLLLGRIVVHTQGVDVGRRVCRGPRLAGCGGKPPRRPIVSLYVLAAARAAPRFVRDIPAVPTLILGRRLGAWRRFTRRFEFVVHCGGATAIHMSPACRSTIRNSGPPACVGPFKVGSTPSIRSLDPPS